MLHMVVPALCTFAICIAITHGDVQLKRFFIARGWHIKKRGDLPTYYTDLHRCIYACMVTDRCQAIAYDTDKQECKLITTRLIVNRSSNDKSIVVIVKDVQAISVGNDEDLYTFAEVEAECEALGVRMMTEDEFIAAADTGAVFGCRCGWVDNRQQFTRICSGKGAIECNQTLGYAFCTKDDDI